MEAPAGRMSLEDFRRELARQTRANYELKGDGPYVCRKCGTGIGSTTCYISVHATEFGDTCAGTGRVWHATLFYCPKCEGEPKNVSTCVHVPMFPERMQAAKLPVPAAN